MTEQPSNAVAEASEWSDVTANVLEFYLRGPVPKKVKPVPIEQRGKIVEFPQEQFAAQFKTEDITERGHVSPSTVLCLGCFLRTSVNGVMEMASEVRRTLILGSAMSLCGCSDFLPLGQR